MKSLLTFVIFTFFVIGSSPRQALASPPNSIFSSPDSPIMRIRERIEYFFAFNTQKKVIVLEKQAERRLTQAENLAKTKSVDQIPPLIKSYETLKERQGGLIRGAPTIDLAGAKERTIEQQSRIEGIKKDMPENAKDVVENSQSTVIKTMIDNIRADENEEKVTEFTEGIKNVLDPGTNVILESAPEVAPGANDINPGNIDYAP